MPNFSWLRSQEGIDLGYELVNESEVGLSGQAPLVGDLATWPEPLAPGATGDTVDYAFRRSPDRRSMVLLDADGEPFVVNRSDFYLQYAGRLGFGRALLSRRLIDSTNMTPPPIVDSSMPVWLAGLEVVDRDISTVDDIGVRDASGRLGTVSMSTLLHVLRKQAEDIGAEYRRLAERLKQQALYDGLTGLPNRAAFATEGAAIVNEAARCGGGAVVFCDLDGFKAINDRFGHAIGDAVLTAVARRFQRVMPPRAMLARLGGDEFAVALSGDLPLAKALAAELRRSLAEPVDALGTAVGLGVSVGIATTAESTSFDALVQRADDAMYAAKRDGRGVSTWRRTAHDHCTLERVAVELLPALESGELRVLFQPLIELGGRRAIGAEALLRWNHPELGAISPADFIPIAEAEGLMLPVGRWVIERALDATAEWQALDHDFGIHINMSTTQLLDDALFGVLQSGTRARGVDPRSVTLEVTETALMTDVGQSIDVLDRLRGAGFKIAIDDFGVGYSSLAYLADLPIDVVKMDARFTRRLLRSERDRQLSSGVAAMGHALGLTVVAEAVELEDEHDHLLALGFDVGQGYLYGRPGVDPTAQPVALEQVFSAAAH